MNADDNRPDFIKAHEFSSKNRESLEKSETCGCFYCLSIFEPSEIAHWLAIEDTALCPHCGIDSVIGSASGYPIERSFLERMKKHWFDTPIYL